MKDKTTKLLSFLLPFVMLLGMIPTTVFAGNGSTLELESITITGVPMPQAGDKVRDYNNKKVASVTIATNPTGAVSGYDIDWYNDEGNNITTETFVAGTTYSYRVAVKMADGYCCTNPTGIDAELNGKKPDDIFPFGSAWNGQTYNSFGMVNNYTIPVTPIEKTYDLTTSVNGGNGSISDSKTGLAENAEETVIFTPDTGYEIDNVTVNGVKATVTGNQLKVTMTENKTVVVTYKKTETQNPTTYTISFDMNGHGTQVDAQTVNEGAKATKPADPTAEGYNFKGWYADENLTNEFDFETAIKADTTVYANWKKKADKPAEPVDPGTDPGTQDPGTEPGTPENPTEPVEPGTTPTVEKFMITVDPNGGTWNDSTAAKIYEIEKGQYLTLPAAPTKEGYTFMYWKGSKYQPGDKYLVEGEHTFTAVWQKNGVSDKTSPKTGDNAMLYVYTLGLLAATSAVLILNSRRNKKEQ